MTYTATGRVQTMTDANDHTTTYQYDSQDRLTTIQFPDGTTNLMAYNSQGDVIKIDRRPGQRHDLFATMPSTARRASTDALDDNTTITYTTRPAT